MTTINNYESLIKKVGGVEKAKAIVEQYKDIETYLKSYRYFDVEKDDFLRKPKPGRVDVINLRTAIAQHKSNNHQETSHCNNSGNCEKRFNPSEVIKQLESDHVTDIHNHISPNTKVVEL